MHPVNTPISPSGHCRPRGQALAEFALVFPLFMVIVGAIIQFGIIFWAQNTVVIQFDSVQ